MNKILAACTIAAVAVVASQSHATPPYLWPNKRAACNNWHGCYAYTDYGAPTALVVPPTAQLQTNWSWGAPSLRISRIDHQFTRNWPGYGPFAGPYASTPHWPSDTNQFGVYYVRGPWWPTQP